MYRTGQVHMSYNRRADDAVVNLSHARRSDLCVVV